jgi:4-aminobutyrate aminotransferase/(S)-3-amino-2-methylpropionate transaminase
MDIPAFDWPAAPFPKYKYPLAENLRENAEIDRKCLEQVEDLLEKWQKKGQDVAGIVIEPIQCEGGDNHPSPEFMRGLQAITKKWDVGLLIDEVQTGCGSTGLMWCYQHYGMSDSPDLLTFSKKMLTGGFYLKKEYRYIYMPDSFKSGNCSSA